MSVGDSAGFFAYSELTVAVSWQSLTTRSDSMAKACFVVLVVLVFLAELDCDELAQGSTRRSMTETMVCKTNDILQI